MTMRTFSSTLPFTRRFGVRGVTCMTNGAQGGGGGNGNESDDLRKRAESGDAEAQYILGVSSAHAMDHKEAVKWYRLAAEQGHAKAQNALGAAYSFGQEGVSQNHEEARKWYRRAAEQGHDDAQYNLGVVYETGEGVSIDYQEAHVWFSVAAANGNTEAAVLADEIMKTRLSPAQWSAAQKEANRRQAEIQRKRQSSEEE